MHDGVNKPPGRNDSVLSPTHGLVKKFKRVQILLWNGVSIYPADIALIGFNRSLEKRVCVSKCRSVGFSTADWFCLFFCLISTPAHKSDSWVFLFFLFSLLLEYQSLVSRQIFLLPNAQSSTIPASTPSSNAPTLAPTWVRRVGLGTSGVFIHNVCRLYVEKEGND